MCDALSWNTSHLPEGVERLLAHCMSHGRRQFVEVAENFPGECRYVLETLGGIWHHDALARERKLSPEERLRFHQEHSSPLMKTRVDGSATGRTEDGAKLWIGEGHPLHASPLAAVDSFPSGTRGPSR